MTASLSFALQCFKFNAQVSEVEGFRFKSQVTSDQDCSSLQEFICATILKYLMRLDKEESYLQNCIMCMSMIFLII